MFRKYYHWTWPLPVRVLITLSNQTFSSLKNSYKIAFFLIDLWTFGATLSMSISNLEWATCPCHSTILQMGSMAKKFIKRKHIMIIKSRPCWRPAIWSVGCRNTRMATSTRFHCNRWVAKVFFVESVIGENRTTCGQTSVNISRQLRRRGWLAVTSVPEILSFALLIKHNAHIDDNQVCIKGVNWCWNAAGLN